MMLRNYKIWILTLLLMSGISFVWGDERNDERQFWDNYRVLVERNIFSRNRSRPLERGVSEPKRTAAPAPESYFVLKGIVQQNKDYIAFFENTRTGEAVKVRKGDNIARGSLKNLTLDYIEFGLDANTVKVVIGNTLVGKTSSAAVTYDELVEWSESSSKSSESATSGEGSEQKDEDEEVLRRLMERRKREVGE